MSTSQDAPIGVFDSGVGGLSVLAALRAELPREDFVYHADTAFAPYGERGEDYVAARTLAIAQELRAQHGIKALVVACNTATAAAIAPLRAAHPGLCIVGVEPALKPAARASRTGHVGVLATRGTLASGKFRSLKASLAGQARYTLQACDGLAEAIERGDAARLQELGSRYMQALGPLGNAPGSIDTVVLGCTHYPFARDTLARAGGTAVQWLETGAPVARQTRRLLEAGTLAGSAGTGRVHLQSSGDCAALRTFAQRWLGLPG